MGGDVASARDFSVRLVADSGGAKAVRSLERSAGPDHVQDGVLVI